MPIHPEGSRTLPSVVSVTEDLEGRQILTGISAKRHDCTTRSPGRGVLLLILLANICFD